MRIALDDLIEITNKKTPKAQAGWFDKHFGVKVEYDCNGVIITTEAFNRMVSAKYGLTAANDEISPDRPKVKLLKNTKPNAKKKAA